MVSVRKSHLMSEHNFEQWLTELALTPAKKQALESLWNETQAYFDALDKTLLADNSFWRWVIYSLYPRSRRRQ